MIINNNATLKGKQIIKGMNDQYRTYACSNDNTTIIIIEANNINMASYILADLSGHCER